MDQERKKKQEEISVSHFVGVNLCKAYKYFDGMPEKEKITHMHEIMNIVIESLDVGLQCKQNGKEYESYINAGSRCVGMLAVDLGSEFTPFLSQTLIDGMFEISLSKSLLKTLSKLYINVASIQPLIQDKLSKVVWAIFNYNAKFTTDSDNSFSLLFDSLFYVRPCAPRQIPLSPKMSLQPLL